MSLKQGMNYCYIVSKKNQFINNKNVSPFEDGLKI